MRTIHSLLLCGLVLAFAACSDTPTSTTSTAVGQTNIDDFRKNAGYSLWFDTGYDAYPGTSAQVKADFETAVNSIKASLDTSHTVLMVVKPTCSCQKTQRYMPQVMKTLDQAGLDHSKIVVYVTDSRHSGLADVKAQYNVEIHEPPAFIVMKNGVEQGRIEDELLPGKTVENELATFFNKK